MVAWKRRLRDPAWLWRSRTRRLAPAASGGSPERPARYGVGYSFFSSQETGGIRATPEDQWRLEPGFRLCRPGNSATSSWPRRSMAAWAISRAAAAIIVSSVLGRSATAPNGQAISARAVSAAGYIVDDRQFPDHPDHRRRRDVFEAKAPATRSAAAVSAYPLKSQSQTSVTQLCRVIGQGRLSLSA